MADVPFISRLYFYSLFAHSPCLHWQVSLKYVDTVFCSVFCGFTYSCMDAHFAHIFCSYDFSLHSNHVDAVFMLSVVSLHRF